MLQPRARPTEQVTARRMVENKNTNPHYYLTMEVCMDDLIAMRAQVHAIAATSQHELAARAQRRVLGQRAMAWAAQPRRRGARSTSWST